MEYFVEHLIIYMFILELPTATECARHVYRNRSKYNVYLFKDYTIYGYD